MTTKPLHAISVMFTALLVAACGDGAPAASSATTGSASKPGAATAASGSEKAPAAPAGKPELIDVPNDKLGYTMKMPKGYATTIDEPEAAMFTFGPMLLSGQITLQPVTKFEDVLIGYVTEGMTLDKKMEGDLFLVVARKDGEPKPHHVYAAPKGAKFSVHCVADDANKDLALEICTSVRAKK